MALSGKQIAFLFATGKIKRKPGHGKRKKKHKQTVHLKPQKKKKMHRTGRSHG